MLSFLDLRTLAFIHVALYLSQAGVLIYVWSRQRNYAPARDWALGSLLAAIGLFLFALRHWAPVVLTEVVSDFFLLPGLMLFYFGIVKATGRAPPLWLGLIASLVCNLLLAWFTLAVPDDPMTIVIQNLFILALLLYVIYACLRNQARSGTDTFRLLAVLHMVLFLACLSRLNADFIANIFALPPDLPRTLWVASSLILFPAITLLLTLHTTQRLQEEILAQSRHDTLTGALNRRGFIESAQREWARCQRHGYPLALLSVDVDHFKRFNDQHGHATGDAALIAVSNAAHSVLRGGDIWCRHGGEEFVALLPQTAISQATNIAERLRCAVEAMSLASPQGALQVSVSVGVAEYTHSHASLSDVLAASDAALYKAKAAGRNRVVSEDREEC